MDRFQKIQQLGVFFTEERRFEENDALMNDTIFVLDSNKCPLPLPQLKFLLKIFRQFSVQEILSFALEGGTDLEGIKSNENLFSYFVEALSKQTLTGQL